MFSSIHYEVLVSIKSRKQSRVPSFTAIYRFTRKDCIPGRLRRPFINYFYTDYIYDDCFARSMKLGVASKCVLTSSTNLSVLFIAFYLKKAIGQNVITLVGTDMGSLISFRQFPSIHTFWSSMNLYLNHSTIQGNILYFTWCDHFLVFSVMAKRALSLPPHDWQKKANR